MNGWWKFHRNMEDHPVWRLSDAQFKVWITILNNANHKDQDWWNGTERITIPAGSFITSQDHLAYLARVSRRCVRGALETLQRLGSIRSSARSNRYTHITLVNYNTYSGSDEDAGQLEGQQRAYRGPTEGLPRATTEEGKKGRMEEESTDLPLVVEQLSLVSPPGTSPGGKANDNGDARKSGRPWGTPEELAALFNESTPDNVPSVRILRGKRREKALRYLRLFPERSFWEEVFAQYRRSKWLQGLTPPRDGHESFTPDFDWLLSVGKDGSENVLKVHDGKYTD